MAKRTFTSQVRHNQDNKSPIRKISLCVTVEDTETTTEVVVTVSDPIGLSGKKIKKCLETAGYKVKEEKEGGFIMFFIGGADFYEVIAKLHGNPEINFDATQLTEQADRGSPYADAADLSKAGAASRAKAKHPGRTK